jgi:ubiquinone/menaquinone biosynthesis C-methylase UbiE
MMKQQRRFKDIGIGGMTARWYDNNTRMNRLAEMKEYAQEASKYLHSGCSVLEVAPGPGYLTIELAKLGICNKLIGLDISKDFVEIAQRNAKQAGVFELVEFRYGNVTEMSFLDNSFDFIICTAAFKNFKEPFKALSQTYRVLKSGGTVLIVDMNRDVSNQQIEAYTKDEFASLISKTAFKQYDIREKGIGFYIYLTK